MSFAWRQLDEWARRSGRKRDAPAGSDEQRGRAGSVEHRRHLSRIGPRGGNDVQLRLNLMPHRHVSSSPGVNRAY